MTKDKLSGLVLAQNRKQFMGYTVFYIHFETGEIAMMALKDVQHIIKKIKPRALRERIWGGER